MKTQNAKYVWTAIGAALAGILFWEYKEWLWAIILEHFNTYEYWYKMSGILIVDILLAMLVIYLLPYRKRKEVKEILRLVGVFFAMVMIGSVYASLKELEFSLLFMKVISSIFFFTSCMWILYMSGIFAYHKIIRKKETITE